jgi:putative transposase
MPRRPRIVQDHSTVHIMQRGNNRSACFFADEDYAFYLEQLDLACKTHTVELHAYVLLPNRVNLLLSASDSQAPSHMMKQLTQRYVQFINRTYQRSGTLWEGRFRSCIVGEEDYVLACHRYIELSPVRAGLVSQPADYRWSSYTTNGEISAHDEGMSGNQPLLTPHPHIQALDIDETHRKQAYREFFNRSDSLTDEIRSATNSNLVLGSESFQRRVGKTLGVRAWRGQAGRPKRLVQPT